MICAFLGHSAHPTTAFSELASNALQCPGSFLRGREGPNLNPLCSTKAGEPGRAFHPPPPTPLPRNLGCILAIFATLPPVVVVGGVGWGVLATSRKTQGHCQPKRRIGSIHNCKGTMESYIFIGNKGSLQTTDPLTPAAGAVG